MYQTPTMAPDPRFQGRRARNVPRLVTRSACAVAAPNMPTTPIAATMTLAAVGFGLAWQAQLGIVVSVLAALLAGGVIGTINRLLIAYGKVTDFIATLGTLGEALEANAVRAPAIIVVGEVVRVAHPEAY